MIAMEYPSYGLYPSIPSEERILQDAETVFDFLIKECGLKPRDIILFGRSMGSGPATHLASVKEPAGLILMSPFTSIRDVVKSLVGRAL